MRAYDPWTIIALVVIANAITYALGLLVQFVYAVWRATR